MELYRLSGIHLNYSNKFQECEGQKYIKFGIQCTFICRKPNYWQPSSELYGFTSPFCGPICESDYPNSCCPGDSKCQLHQGCIGKCKFIKCDFPGCNPCLSHMEVCGFCYDIDSLECHYHDFCKCGNRKWKDKDLCSFCEYTNSDEFYEGLFGNIPQEIFLYILDGMSQDHEKHSKQCNFQNPYMFLKDENSKLPKLDHDDFYNDLEEMDEFIELTEYIFSDYLNIDKVTEEYGSFEDEFYFSTKGGRKFKRSLNAY